MDAGVGPEGDARQLNRTGREVFRDGIRIMGTDNRDFVAIPAKLLVEEPGLEDCTVRVRDSDEVAQERDAERTPKPCRQARERMGFCDVRVPRGGDEARESKY